MTITPVTLQDPKVRKDFGIRLSLLMKHQNLSTRDAANLLEIGAAAVSRWKKGEAIPGAEATRVRLTEILFTSYEKLFGIPKPDLKQYQIDQIKQMRHNGDRLPKQNTTKPNGSVKPSKPQDPQEQQKRDIGKFLEMAADLHSKYGVDWIITEEGELKVRAYRIEHQDYGPNDIPDLKK